MFLFVASCSYFPEAISGSFHWGVRGLFLTFSCRSVAKSCLTLCNPVDCSMPGFPVPHHFLEFAQVHVHWISDAIQPSYPLLPSLLLPSVFPSIRIFSSELALHIRWQKYWSFSISLFNEYSGLISFRMNWLDLLAIQGTLESLLQHHSSKTKVLSVVSNSLRPHEEPHQAPLSMGFSRQEYWSG